MSDYKSKAHLRAQRRAKAESERKRRNGFKLKRTMGQLRINQSLGSTESVVCRLVINTDMTETGVRLFLPQAVEVGQKVAVTLEYPKKFYITGTVMACVRLNIPKNVISSENFDWRVAIEFIFNSDEERESVKIYCAELDGGTAVQKAA